MENKRKDMIEKVLKWRAGVQFLGRCKRKSNKSPEEVERLDEQISSLKCNIKEVMKILNMERAKKK